MVQGDHLDPVNVMDFYEGPLQGCYFTHSASLSATCEGPV